VAIGQIDPIDVKPKILTFCHPSYGSIFVDDFTADTNFIFLHSCTQTLLFTENALTFSRVQESHHEI
jgi:hypothetical protein